MITITDNGSYLQVNNKAVNKMSVMLVEIEGDYVNLVLGKRKDFYYNGVNVININYQEVADHTFTTSIELKSYIVELLQQSTPASDIAAIIAIINGLTGEQDTTYLNAVNSLAIMLGGVGQGRVIDTLNEIGALLCGEWPEDNFARDDDGHILYLDDGQPFELEINN